MTHHRGSSWPKWTILVASVFSIAFVTLAVKYPATASLLLARFTQEAYHDQRQASPTGSVPDYFQTTPEILPGPTGTGRAPFLAASNPAPFGHSRTFVPNAPLETALPIVGDTTNASIFHLMGHVSPYFPNPDGFGVDEFSLPKGSNISQLHMLSRHGSRYPTGDTEIARFSTGLADSVKTGSATFNGSLDFLNTWSYGLGHEILVPIGRQELFDSGVLHYYDYGHLYNTSSKIIARTTSQDRMLKSAEYFMAGFFGLEWTNNATLEVILEGQGFNNSLAGYCRCNNSNLPVNHGGTNASRIWEEKYLTEAVKRFSSMTEGYNWTISSIYNAQTLCPYETVAFGYSAFCDLFTFSEWQGFEYSLDLMFAGGYYFQSPTGRALGIGYVQEILARLQQHVLTTHGTQANFTLDSNIETFPLNQTLYFDFSHDVNIAAVLTAFGLTQFADVLPTSGPPKHQQLIASHLTPFGARLDMEIIEAPHPVRSDRSDSSSSSPYDSGAPTTYIHFILNQRTLPLGKSLPECGPRDDGWCELGSFLKSQESSLQEAQYDYSCNGDYPAAEYGSITNGAPLG